ncbi:MAG: PP2C family protein-serine/threonine phosphatase, partial [Vicinamibacterales bacterium]
GDRHLVIRAAVLTSTGDRVVVADVPVDTDVIAKLDDRTGTRIRGVTLSDEHAGPGAPGATASTPGGVLSVFQHTVVFMDWTDWDTGRPGRATIGLDAPLPRLVERLAAAQSAQLPGALGGWNIFLTILAIVGVLFLIIQGSALVMGGVLARSITSAVHELFTGTERVRQGDFAHRISIESRDQLGDLADSFNRMSASIEHLLHVQREKQRLDDELRIAREIQKSLLPVAVPRIDGLGVADLCEPAREVGGDYYDFFELGPRQLGVLVADVSGKGTSAALYMAELKGLMLALSHTQRSPRRLLIDVNRLLAAHLDNRSFITMTYAVVDLDAGTLTSARAGHPPLIVAADGRSDVIVSEGMVLGLRLPGAGERFEEMLEEHVRPIAPGDAIVLYTDGITEAMDRDGELFGDEALARVLASHCRLDAAGIRERVVREVKAFVGDAEPHDDMTMVVLKVGEGAAA